MFKLTLFFAIAALLSTALGMPLSKPNMVTVEFNGHIIEYNADMLRNSSTASPQPALAPRDPGRDQCDGHPSFSVIADPNDWAPAADCKAIEEWFQGSQQSDWGIHTNTKEAQLFAKSGDCQLSMGTENRYDTYVGANDAVRLLQGAASRCQNDDKKIGCVGNVGCANWCTNRGSHCSGNSNVFWRIANPY